MNAKEYLEQVEKINTIIQNKLIEQRQWMDIALNITANMDGERVQSSGTSSKMSDAIEKCVDMTSEIDSIVDKLVAVKREVVATIEQLDNPTEYNLLHLRYIQMKTLDDISQQYHKEYGWATTTHGRALKNLQIILDAKGL